MRNNFPATLALISALLLGGVFPARAQVFNPETAMLENGMQVVVLPNHRAPVVTHMIWYKAGAMDDPWGKSGIAHFLEHLLFKGTPTYPEGQYSRLISQMGGEENAFTSNDYTAYYATIGKQHLEKIMELESDRMANWQVNDDQVARERSVVLKERQQRTENNPVSHFFEDVNAILYPNFPYQRPVIGWRSEIASLNADDARHFVETHYAPNNAILVMSGDITLAEIKPLVDRYYAPIIPSRKIAPRAQGDVVAIDSSLTLEKTSPLVTETIWSRHILVPPARPETIVASDALMMLEKILGDNRIGRLYNRMVVKDKIATSAGTSFNPVGVGPQRFAFLATPAPGVSIDRLEKAVNEEIARLVRDGVTDQEIADAAQSLETAAVYARDSVTGPAMFVGGALASGLDIATIEAWPTRMRNVTKDAVNEAARALFDPKRPWATAILKPESAAK